MDNKRIYSIIYLICLVLLINSLPFGLLIDNEVILFIINFVIKVLSIVYILVYIKKENLNILKFNKINTSSFRLIPLLLLCISNFIVGLIQNSNINEKINLFTIISGLIISIGVSVIEELLFRSQVLEEFLKSKSKLLSVVYSSLIFGSVHLLNISSLGSIPIVLVQVCYTFFLGVVLGYIYFYSKNIALPIIFHFLFNFFNDILVKELFDVKWDIVFYLVNIFIGVILFLYIFIVSKINKVEEEDNYASENMDN